METLALLFGRDIWSIEGSSYEAPDSICERAYIIILVI